MANLFISYSRQDQAFVHQLYDTLIAMKHKVFVDWESIPPSAQWLKEISEAIDDADTFLFVISPGSLSSVTCKQELALAEQNKKRLIPVMYREVPASEVPQSLAAINWIFFRETDDFTTAMNTLEKAIATDLDYVKQSSRLLVQAKV